MLLIHYIKMEININKSREYYILGKYPVLEIFNNKSKRLKEIYILEKNKKFFNEPICKVNFVDKNFFKKISKNNDYVHQGFAAKVYDYYYNFKEILNLNLNVLMLDAINDPRNLGAIFRNCLAFDVRDIVIEKKYYNFDNISMHLASSGATEYLRIHEVSNINNCIKTLKKKIFGFMVWMEIQKIN
jgi:23S rRNA (guanosine2251-2'-O)-methyltransferase